MARAPFVVLPSRKPAFWAAVEGREPTKAKPVPVKKAAKKVAKKKGARK
jgi:hypothetical protein